MTLKTRLQPSDMFFPLFILALPLLAAAQGGGIMPASQCPTGGLQCCQSVQNARNILVDVANSPAASTLLALLGIVLQGVDIMVGINCTPLNVIGIGGNSCSAQPVCCSGNNFNGVTAIGCVPVDLSL
ncbi:hydrophobin-251 [Lyophyllum atratum]|nr:hydrophobin-251 [Lyophyllum atratum]